MKEPFIVRTEGNENVGLLVLGDEKEKKGTVRGIDLGS